MKQILAFGDSLTWGADPVTGLRHPHRAQWPVVLESGLSGARVIGDGLGGRTTCRDDHAGPGSRNGAFALQLALAVHMPLDLVIIMLGTNDIKPVHGSQAISAQAGMRRLAEIVATFPYKPRSAVPSLLIVAPPPCGPSETGGPAGGRLIEESELFAPLYASLARELGCAFFDAGTVARASTADGVHLDAENTIAIGKALVQPVARLLT
ncbi:MAG TPA: SGNH/GDSL hydrolase family protein [Paracoccus sp. (in: a-proteobacteria)]|uniref:SGNH/GDSL hydrolase family protein n=1 Tax=Paracoccus sp. TaxID=267 RepID=UPI002CF6DBC1|nr:SGNH/GDSL hydrolase family protein [Paracoccus sp. (in: a-proteobacteria)]HWL58515.1 SGNH/GDSL hydrolase family protein [Paracoccus sp. (in: a-proteobacteria)]